MTTKALLAPKGTQKQALKNPSELSHVRMEALVVAIADCGSDVVAAERIGAVRRLHNASRQHARGTRSKLPLGHLASRGHARQRRGLHRRLAVVRCRVGFQSGMDIRALPVDDVPESAYRDLQLRRDAGRASGQLLCQQLLGRSLSEPPVVEQQNLLGRPASHVATAAAASTGSAPAAAASTGSASAVEQAAERWKASIRRTPAIRYPTAFHR